MKWLFALALALLCALCVNGQVTVESVKGDTVTGQINGQAFVTTKADIGAAIQSAQSGVKVLEEQIALTEKLIQLKEAALNAKAQLEQFIQIDTAIKKKAAKPDPGGG